MPKPFRDIDPVTMGRRDDPPGFRVFREAAVNLLIHQDYGDHSRKAVIKFYRDGIQFWNPGDVFGDDSRLWEPGEKEVRNPAIAMGMRRIAMCEQAGTGMRMMREEWQKMGHPVPTYKNDRSWKAFEFFIPELDKEVDRASELIQAMFGTDADSGSHLRTDDVPSLSQVCPKSVSTESAVNVLRTAAMPADLQSLMRKSGHTNRTRFRNTILKPLIESGLMIPSIPDKPRSSKQRYRLTEKGLQILTQLDKTKIDPKK